MVGRGGYENVGIELGHLVDPNRIPDFLEISEPFTEEQSLLLDQQHVQLKGLIDDYICGVRLEGSGRAA